MSHPLQLRVDKQKDLAGSTQRPHRKKTNCVGLLAMGNFSEIAYLVLRVLEFPIFFAFGKAPSSPGGDSFCDSGGFASWPRLRRQFSATAK